MSNNKYGDEITDSLKRAEIKELRIQKLREINRTRKLNENKEDKWIEPTNTLKIPQPVDIEYIRILAQTEKAYFIRLIDNGEQWFPRSYCAFNLGLKRIRLSRGFARTLGLERFLDEP
jgi:hypothetical protein